MTLSFPGSPSVDDTYTEGGRTWRWNGTTWKVVTSTITSGSIGTAELDSNAVTAAKIASGAVTEAKIADSSITTAKIAAGAVVEADIANNAVTAGKLGTDVQLGYRNVVINGAMQVAQRGTSTASITSSGYYTADRWYFVVINMGTWTMSEEADAPTGSGFCKSSKVLCTTADASPAAADFTFLEQRIEGQNLQSLRKGTSDAQQVSLSFWVKSNATGTYVVELNDNDNTRQIAGTYTIDSSGIWEKKTFVFAGDNTGVLDNDNNASLRLAFWLGAGSDRTSGTLQTTWGTRTTANLAVGQTNLAAATNNYWQITGVQLEAGAVATPFEFEDYGTTLLKCQRYYQRIQPNGTSKLLAPVGRATGTTFANFVQPFTVEMRTAPTALEQSGTASDYFVADGDSNQQCNAVPAFGASTTATHANTNTEVASGLTSGDACVLITASGSSAGYLAWSAEL